ncbi:hypothetical protein PACTADRAFT_72563 [Pachysolen tannophilus NRRL Y-2460]|uniref:Ribosomal RNA-processing protein 8 n=1 Tax=Pachysolen tannophilus NRRL Y-2460 TaxID=669874 RepID=A0A1E4TNI1_PACTA|nr:hypothetical protein PACTADRAFT_72563 [Pachysolen tannophilus NRRL Y-2460]
MSLFEVKGWNLKSKEVKVVKPEKKVKNKKKRTTNKVTKPTGNLQDKKKKLKSEKDGNDVVEAEADVGVDADVDVDVDAGASEMSNSKLTPLQKKMMAKLSGSRFRWINEQFYTISSEDALKLVQEQPSLFDEYHKGFRSQVQSWPENPVDVFFSQIKTRTQKPVNAPGGLPGLPNKQVVIADMGCGEAQLSLDISNFLKTKNKKQQQGNRHKRLDIIVHSFDLKKTNNRVTVADIRNVPLQDGSCSIVIFCLALMGTNFLDFIKEAYRLLTPRGELWISEIKSRFQDQKVQDFIDSLKLFGFHFRSSDDSNKMFIKFEFFKPLVPTDYSKAPPKQKTKFIELETEKESLEKRRKEQPEGQWLLKPCIYKRR